MDKQKVIQALNKIILAARKATLPADEHDHLRDQAVFLASELELNEPVIIPKEELKEVK